MPFVRRALICTPLLALGCAFAVVAPASALPTADTFADVPSRTSLSFEGGGVRLGTSNDGESRPGLSTVKLYLADYALRHGDGSPEDRELAERMVRASDDGAASTIDSKYPGAIDAVAAEFGLSSTSRGGFWGNSYTSTADTVRFLEEKKRTDPASPVLGWMNTSSPVATDGTLQNWGTDSLPEATGTKWGWADDASSVVASASIGDGFSVAANTYGSAAMQTADVLAALGNIELTARPDAFPTVDDLLEAFHGLLGPNS